MNGAAKSRKGSHALRKRCPHCTQLRKFCEPPGDVGGEYHPRRPGWFLVSPGNYICGWCVLTALGIPHARWWEQLTPLELDAKAKTVLSQFHPAGGDGIERRQRQAAL